MELRIRRYDYSCSFRKPPHKTRKWRLSFRVKISIISDDILPFFNEYIYVNKHGVIQTEINSQALSSLMSPFSSTPLYVALSNIRELLQSSTMANTSNIVLPIYQFYNFKLRYWCKNNFWSFVNSTARLIELISQSLKVFNYSKSPNLNIFQLNYFLNRLKSK